MVRIITVFLTIMLFSGMVFAQCAFKGEKRPAASEDKSEGRILNLGEPTQEERSQMQREQQETRLEDSGGESMQDMATGTTEDERDLEFGPRF